MNQTHFYHQFTAPIALAYAALVASLLFPNQAHAYIGPGLSIGGVIFAFIILASLALAFYALIWFPLKRKFKSKSTQNIVHSEDEQS